jgi:hypothetical protein
MEKVSGQGKDFSITTGETTSVNDTTGGVTSVEEKQYSKVLPPGREGESSCPLPTGDTGVFVAAVPTRDLPNAKPQFDQKVQDLVAVATKATLRAASIDLPQAVEKGKETVSMISEHVSSKKWLPATERELEVFTRGIVLGVLQTVEAEQITHVVNKVLAETSIQENLSRIADKVAKLDEAVEKVTDKITSADDPNRSALRWLVLGGAIFLAVGAGAFIPLLAGAATAEVILTNEVAITAVVLAAATLIKE